jgi:hypothetical protein
MKIIKWIGIVLVLLLVLIAVFLWYMGLLNTLQVSEQEAGPYTYVYEKFVGPYWDTEHVFQKVDSSLKAEGIATDKAIGIYYDDPAKVAKEKLRSDCGFVLQEKDLSKVPDLKKKYHVATMPMKKSIVVEFPKRNKMSYLLGPMKGYPGLMKYAQEKNYKMAMPYELYAKEKILYIMEIVK